MVVTLPLLPFLSAESTLVDLVQYRAAHQPTQRGYIFLTDGEQETAYSYREIDARARAIAAALQADNIQGRALLLYQPGLEFITAFLGCLYAGVVAVPAYPPRRGQNLLRLKLLVADAQPSAILTTNVQLELQRADKTDTFQCQQPTWIATDKISQELAQKWQKPDLDANTLAMLQYTSGSTGNPKGVMITHRNLLHNSALIAHKFEHTPTSRVVSWLPFYHDMGLIGGILQPLYCGFLGILMSPVLFLQKPLRWLQAISYYRATTSGAPNFAYEMCWQKITSKQKQNLDLSSWELAFTGAEMIRAQTLERFAQAFAECGFRREAFYPCYGLAEATLFVSGGAKAAIPNVCSPVEIKTPQNAIVSCGQVEFQQMAIVNPDTGTLCAENQVGEIWIAGASVASGYWMQPQKTAQTFQAHLTTSDTSFLRTGDLGFVRQGELYVTGRIKDLIIIRGCNYYPEDIELTVQQSHPSLRANHGAAFSIEVAGIEQLVIVQEVKREYWRSLNIEEVTRAMRRAVSQTHELQVYGVALLKTGSIPKTSSGKIQRHACKTEFIAKNLQVVGSWQDVSAPIPELQLVTWLRDYATTHINSRLIDERRSIPPHIVLDFGNQGLLGMQVPAEYGGLGLTHTETMQVLAQLGAIDLTLALFVGLNNILGIRPLRYGSKTLQNELLPLLASGRELAAFALSEPNAGSNPQAISARAIAQINGGWRLQGTKLWSGSAAWAGVTNVFVQHQNADGTLKGISAFAVRRGTGLRQGKEALTMGMRGMVQNTVELNNVPVTAEQMLGEPGAGMQVAQDAMMYGRLAIASASVGGMKRCAQLMLRYSSRRVVSTGKLLTNPFILKSFSEITAAITAVETLVKQIAHELDAGGKIPVEIYTACKTAAPEFYWQAADSLVQVLGGRGYIETNIAPQILRDARVLRIFEGPTETLNMFLGSRLMNNSSELETFMCDRWQAPAVYQELQRAAHQIQQQSNDATTDPVNAKQRAALQIGEITTWAILWAVLQYTSDRAPSTSVQTALQWTQFHFEQKTQARHQSILSPQATTELVSSYVNAIGDIEQTSPGEDWELDELLRKSDEPLTPPAVISDQAPHETPHSNLKTTASIQQWLIDWLSQKLKQPKSAIDPRKAFADYGIDSVIAVELAQDLQEWLNYPRAIEATIAWNFPTIEALSNYLQAPQTNTTELKSSSRQTPQSSEALELLSESELAKLLAAEITAAKEKVSE